MCNTIQARVHDENIKRALKSKLYSHYKYLLNNESYCAFLIEPPQSISQFMTTLECNLELSYDLNGDGEVDNVDLILIITFPY